MYVFPFLIWIVFTFCISFGIVFAALFPKKLASNLKLYKSLMSENISPEGPMTYRGTDLRHNKMKSDFLDKDSQFGN